MPSWTKARRMKKTVHTYLCLLIVLCGNVFAQKDTLHLGEITVTDYRSRLISQNFQEVKADSASLSNFASASAAQLLLQQNFAFAKSYGPANIASMSVRGSTAQQTAVIWNGMNINNPMLGEADISLLPVAFFNSISLQKGALSGYWGSGAMAGVLNLQSGAPVSGTVVKGGFTYSSFNNFTQWAAADLAIGKWSSSTKLFCDLAANQYTYYRNADSLSTQTQTHARSTQYAFMQDIGYKMKRSQLGVHIWCQNADRQVPYTLQEIKQDAAQQDGMFRVLADWKYKRDNYSLTARGAFFDESLVYNNKTYYTSSNSIFKTAMADVEAQFFFAKGFMLTAGTSNSFSVGRTESYIGQQQMERNALYENLSWSKARVNVNVYGRQEIFNAKTFVPTGGVTSSVKITKWLSAKVNAGSVYRYPTLNDLYWNPGGNAELKPEHGFSEEGSLLVNYTIGKFSLQTSGTIFNRNVKDWIMWLPGKNGVWSPQNINQVWSRGGESNSGIAFSAKKLKTSVNVITNYVLSIPVQTTLENDGSKGRQLPYVPMYSGSGVFALQYKNTSLRAVYTYTGYRYLSSDNYNYLAPYQLFDLRLAHTFSCKNFQINIFAEANNLLNENYYSVSQYPMPLRNFKAGLIFQYQKQNKNKNT